MKNPPVLDIDDKLKVYRYWFNNVDIIIDEYDFYVEGKIYDYDGNVTDYNLSTNKNSRHHIYVNDEKHIKYSEISNIYVKSWFNGEYEVYSLNKDEEIFKKFRDYLLEYFNKKINKKQEAIKDAESDIIVYQGLLLKLSKQSFK